MKLCLGGCTVCPRATTVGEGSYRIATRYLAMPRGRSRGVG